VHISSELQIVELQPKLQLNQRISAAESHSKFFQENTNFVYRKICQKTLALFFFPNDFGEKLILGFCPESESSRVVS
jgi:hypothetical protein